MVFLQSYVTMPGGCLRQAVDCTRFARKNSPLFPQSKALYEQLYSRSRVILNNQTDSALTIYLTIYFHLPDTE